MAVKLRFKRMGRRKLPFYRLVAIDSRTRRDGAEIERLGWYDPLTSNDQAYSLNEERIFYWLGVGAQPSRTVKNLFSKAGISLKWHMLQNGKSPSEIEVAFDKWQKQQLEQQRRREALDAQKKREEKPKDKKEPHAELEGEEGVEPAAVTTDEEPAATESQVTEPATELVETEQSEVESDSDTVVAEQETQPEPEGEDNVQKETLDETPLEPPVTEETPAVFSVTQNSPNPFNTTTTIALSLAKAGTVTIEIFNVAGQKVDTIMNEFMDAGSFSVMWDATDFSAGVYFYTVKSTDFSQTMKMTLLK